MTLAELVSFRAANLGASFVLKMIANRATKLNTNTVNQTETLLAAYSDANSVLKLESLSTRLSNTDTGRISLESSSAGLDALSFEELITRLAVDWLTFTIDQSETVETLDLDALVQKCVPLLALDRANNLRALSVSESVIAWATNSSALAVFKLEVGWAADSSAGSIWTHNEASVTLLNTSGGLLVDLLHNVAWWASLVDALLAVPLKTLAFVTVSNTLSSNDMIARATLNLGALAVDSVETSWAVDLEALSLKKREALWA